jgi:hypothetical protein
MTCRYKTADNQAYIAIVKGIVTAVLILPTLTVVLAQNDER